MLDDVLDVSGPPERTGKPRGADLFDGTVTLPLILARREDPSLTVSVRCAEEAAAVCDRVAATGALEQAREKAFAYVDEAKALVGEIELSQPRTDALLLVADGVVKRYA
jgi:geranylgeranyl pyrophosphate synthase